MKRNTSFLSPFPGEFSPTMQYSGRQPQRCNRHRVTRLWLLMTALPFLVMAQPFSRAEKTAWEKQAADVTIIRDEWGIPHVYGKTDADAVFGLLYAQCEDDFPRVEANYIEKLGRMAELKGETALYEDLLMRMIIDSADAIKDYQQAPPWMKKLCDAFAAGINYYLYTHPGVQPSLLHRFEPWYPFLWTDGSIGAINTADITASDLQALFTDVSTGMHPSLPNTSFQVENPSGSNGFAFAPKKTQSGHSILYINPHVTFYFRPEVHMVSEEGLNAYGAVTWGQFFVYQGFNAHCGWMHTSSYVDVADTYSEKITHRKDGPYYFYENRWKKVLPREITVQYRSDQSLVARTFTAWYTHHGPVMAKKKGNYISLRADNRLSNGLIQCWQRIKSTNLSDFQNSLALKGNISNNTVYADVDGNIAYWHGNRIPKKDPQLNWRDPVDGTTAQTEWQGTHDIRETVHYINPPNGWLQNCNATPFTAAGKNSLDKKNFPAYMAPDGENFRGLNAVRLLEEEKKYTLDEVIAKGYDRNLTAFAWLLPPLIQSFEKDVAPEDTLFALLAGPIAVLKKWDYHTSTSSIATTLAIEWGQRLLPLIYNVKNVEEEEADIVTKTSLFARQATTDQLLLPLRETIRDLESRFGKWQVAWGSINRFQRISSDKDHPFDDSKESLPVGFASSTWGMLPSYTSKTFTGTKMRYGINGNSFVCAVEFGPRIIAKSLLAGGESGDPHSPHFFDQGKRYTQGTFKDVWFYEEDVLAHAQKKYHPGN